MKWYWTQCNAFEGTYRNQQLSVTTGGGIRIIKPIGRRECLGMVCVHYNGTFYEAVPWTSVMKWNVSTWGSWQLSGRSTFDRDRMFDVDVVYECDPTTDPGLVFRAPTPDEGMVYFCRDTFVAQTNLSLWALEYDEAIGQYKRVMPPVIDNAYSRQGGAEIGGGPWWTDWRTTSEVKQPILSLLRLPLRLQRLGGRLMFWKKRRGK